MNSYSAMVVAIIALCWSCAVLFAVDRYSPISLEDVGVCVHKRLGGVGLVVLAALIGSAITIPGLMIGLYVVK